MPKASRTVKVREIPYEPFRYQVESWNDPDLFHTVDLLAYGGESECDCWDFRGACRRNRMRLGPGVQIGYGDPHRPNKSRTRCRHISVAREKCLNDRLKLIAEEIKEKENQ